MKRFIGCLGIAVAVALPATAGAATKTYGGKINKGGTIAIDALLTGGEPSEVEKMRFKKFPANCSVSGPSIVRGRFNFNNVSVVNDTFSINDTDPDGNRIFFNGEFNNSATNIAGKLKLVLQFTGPNQECTTRKRSYKAERGAPGPKVKGTKVLGLRL